MGMTYQKNHAFIMAYTRPATDDYADGLARSIHFACSRDGVHMEPLNRNYGILFAEATVDEKNVLHPKGVENVRLFCMADGHFGIAASRVQEDGTPDEESSGQVLVWTTRDFITFDELGLLPLTAVPELSGSSQRVELDSSLCDRAALYWSRLYSTQVHVAKQVEVQSADVLQAVQATVVYSDGSTTQKSVSWQLDDVNFQQPGRYTVHGTVQNTAYRFPLAIGYGDPVILPWEGRYYFIATDDNRNDVGFYIRESNDIAGLFYPDTEQHLILGLDEARGFVQTFWAPEFHVIGDELYLLFAISGTEWSPQCHLMKLKKGAPLTEANSWEEPIRIQKQDGSWLGEHGITLDMTHLEAGGRSYMVWSYRERIGKPEDTGSMLYIATVDPSSPWKLTSDPVLLSRPLYGWENVNGTINNEGPYSFISNGKVYLTYSGGSAMSYTYALGLLTADVNADLLSLASWTKRTTPVLSYYSVDGEFGPGHNSFFIDGNGDLMIAYHAEDALDHITRCDGIRRVHFNLQNEPIFDLSAERDLHPALSTVQTCVIVS